MAVRKPKTAAATSTGSVDPTTAVACTPTPASTGSAAWNVKVGSLATALGVSQADVESALAPLVGAPSDRGAKLLGNPAYATKIAGALAALGAELVLLDAVAALSDAPVAPLPAAPAVLVSGDGHATVRERADAGLLPRLPETSESLLNMLRVGGVAKFTKADAEVAVRGAFTRSCGVDRILPTLLEAVLRRSENLDEPVPPLYYQLRKAQGRRSYADVLEAFDGSITSVSVAEQQRFLNKIDDLWPVLAAFQQQLDAYRQMHKDENNDLATALQAMRNGPDDIEYPEPGPVVAAARGVIDRFNRAFAGTGIATDRTVGKDLIDDGKYLRDPGLPGMLGAGSFEEMIRKLELTVPSDAAEQETQIASFVVGVIDLPNQPIHLQPRYILALQRCGKPITWPTPSTNRRNAGNSALPGIGSDRNVPPSGRRNPENF